MTNDELDAQYAIDCGRYLKRMRLKPSERAEYDAAERDGDWAAVSRFMGEDVGID